MAIFHCYVSSPEGNRWIRSPLPGPHMQQSADPIAPIFVEESKHSFRILDL